jgi:uncharacterized protein
MNIFNIYLPVAGIHFNVMLLVVIGFCVGVIGGFFGVGGGWIITPALNIFGFHMAFAIGTGLSDIFGQSLAAIGKHQRMGTVDWKLGSYAVITSLLGFEAGSRIVIAMQKAGDAGAIIRWCYVIFLSGLGSFMFYDYFVLSRKRLNQTVKGNAAKDSGEGSGPRPAGLVHKLHNIDLPPIISFPISNVERVSMWVVILVFLCTGFLSGILGIGGGFIILPALVYLIGVPTVIAVGTCLMTVLATAAFGCFTYAMDGKVELMAAMFMLIGASIGAQIGATAVRFIKGYGIRLLFAIMIIIISFSVLSEQFYKMTMMHFFQNSSGVILVGTAVAMTVIIIAKFITGLEKEAAGKT